MSGRPGIEPPAELNEKPALRLLTCGSVDDGKSTLIGRLLFEQNLVPDDQLAALRRDSAQHGTTGAEMDFALLVDGLEAERQQGITIDVAYRYARTARRSFIIADTPGHEQYTRNMATGASNSDLAILLVDARKGLLTQTRRHATIVSLLGIRSVVLAVNKIDLVGYDEAVFAGIVDAFRLFAAPLGFTDVTAIPLSARHGDNLSAPSPRMPWYAGPALVEHLETVDIADERRQAPFRLPVQWVNRPDLDFRGLAGTVASGRIAVGDAIAVAGHGRGAAVKRILVADRDAASAEAGDAVTLTLTREIDAARGDVLGLATALPTVADRFDATVIWMDEQPLRLRRSYLLKLATRTVPASVTALLHRLDVDSGAPQPAAALGLNEVGRVTLQATAPLGFDSYAENRTTGAFILIDRDTNRTAAAGIVLGEPRRDGGAQALGAPTAADRSRMKNQRASVILLRGRAAGATATALDALFYHRGLHTALIAAGTPHAAAVAAALRDAGLVVICAADDGEAAGLRADLGDAALHEFETTGAPDEAVRLGDILAGRLAAPSDLLDWSI